MFYLEFNVQKSLPDMYVSVIFWVHLLSGSMPCFRLFGDKSGNLESDPSTDILKTMIVLRNSEMKQCNGDVSLNNLFNEVNFQGK